MLHTSGPIAIVVAGLLIGNQGRQWAMSDTTREHLEHFWELLDELLNAVLFVLIGLEVLVLSFQCPYLMAGLAAIPIVLAARWLSVFVQVKAFSVVRDFTERTITILTWSGLRGGISVALTLSLPVGPERDAAITITYVVVFSILVQGLTINRVLGTGVSSARGDAFVTRHAERVGLGIREARPDASSAPWPFTVLYARRDGWALPFSRRCGSSTPGLSSLIP